MDVEDDMVKYVCSHYTGTKKIDACTQITTAQTKKVEVCKVNESLIQIIKNQLLRRVWGSYIKKIFLLWIIIIK